MNKPIVALVGALCLSAGACQDNPAAPNRDVVVAGSAQSIQALITGLNAQLRATDGPTSSGAASPYYAFGDVMARDAIRPDNNEARWVTEFYETQPDPSDFIGGAIWSGYYIAIRAAHSLLKDPSLTALPAAQQAAARGYVHVVEALCYIQLIEYRDNNGIAIQGDDPTIVTPIRTKQAALTYMSALLDTAATDLTTAGSISVPFTVPPGYMLHGDYSTVDNLLRLARGLKGKVEVYRAADAAAPNVASAAVAITALNAALADAGTPDATYLAKGPYLEFNPNAPESFPNPIVDLKLLVTDNFVNSILPNDARRANIIPATKQSATKYSATNRARITDPASSGNLTVALPLIRNAEFYLLRAQAEIAAGNLPAALADVNVVHTVEGGLPPLPAFADAAAAQQAVLYEYRYSFILQGPQHLVALREYKGLNAAYVSQPGIPTPGVSTDAFVQMLPIPSGEVDARKGDVTPKP